MQPKTYELKYCERCGSLRLRRAASVETYCEPCGQMLLNGRILNHVERATAVLRKSRAKSIVAPVVSHPVQAGLPFGRLQ
jgi:ribosomal protein L37AE/L43A